MNRTIVATGLMLITCGLAGPALAIGQVADVVIYDRVQKQILPVHVHQGRHYVVGHPGNEYEIRLRNRQRGDILTVVSVDGIDAISGATADWQHGGYVLGRCQRFRVQGWRKSLDRVAAFYFTALGDSYAGRTGRPDHIGVIGVAVFRRKPDPVAQWAQQESRSSGEVDAPVARDDVAASGSASRGSSATMRKAERLGTGHGRPVASQVKVTEFDRATAAPAEIITIFYDSYRNLVAQGIIQAPSIARPEPFPGRFSPDPQ